MIHVSKKQQRNAVQPSPRARKWNPAPAIAATLTIAIGAVAAPARSQTLSEKILGMERDLEQEFEDYFAEDLAEVDQDAAAIAATLDRLSRETGSRSAVIWAIPRGDHLHLVAIAPGKAPFVRDLYDVPDERLRNTVRSLQWDLVTSQGKISPPQKSGASQQLYQWIVETVEQDYLKDENIETLLFCLGNGLRGLPLAALNNGQEFLLEKYSLAHIPAFNLIQTNYTQLQSGKVVAMGASEFQDQSPLPAVPLELANIATQLRSTRSRADRWTVYSFLNQRFTLNNLQRSLRTNPNVVHLATHAEFRSGRPEDSYIQLWNQSLGLDEINRMPWREDRSLELLVLSACNTAIGDDSAELGFAGIALKTGIKSVIASLWNVSDVGTLALMSEFYHQLGRTSTKAEALRQAQLNLLRGTVRFEGDRLLLSEGSIELPLSLVNQRNVNLSSPYSWAAFSMISSPW